ncbi:MAG: hypothetical protein ACRDTH_14845 [Pseudonocardiaceae bacterium]
MTQTIKQGTTTGIKASDLRIDGVLTDMTGWSIHAVLRRDHVAGAIVAEWHTTPTGSQGQAVAGNGTAELKITPAMSSPWTWSRGVVHAEATEPGVNGRVARIIDEDVYLDREAVT